MKEIKLIIHKRGVENGYYINSNLPKVFKCGYHFNLKSNILEIFVSAATDFEKNNKSCFENPCLLMQRTISLKVKKSLPLINLLVYPMIFQVC